MEQGVDTVFGYPGVSVLKIYDELYKNRRSIRHILTSHEQGAAHAADGYARATRRTGVCIATSGPGATNLVTGIAAAFMDSSPVVFITCNVPESQLGRDAFQEVDITGIAMPITKCCYLVRTAGEIADTIREAFALASSGRPGPVLIDIMGNAVVETAEYEPAGDRAVTARRAARLLAPVRIDEEGVAAVAKALDEAERPLIMAGGGVVRSGASEALLALAEKTDTPVCTTMMGLGAISCDNALSLGMAGVYGDARARRAVNECDLLLAVGVRFSDRVTGPVESFAPGARIVHIDVDRSEIDKNVMTDLHIVGDAGSVLSALAGKVERRSRAKWRAGIAETEEAAPGAPAEYVRAVKRAVGGDAVVVTDVGQHQLWTCRYFGFTRPGELITSGGFGAMGFGLGAAIGARAGDPSRTVVHVTGDGSFRMNLTELSTEVKYGLPVVTVVFNNNSLGMVRQNQRQFMHSHFWQTTLDRGPDFMALARAYGLEGRRVTDAEGLYAAVKELAGKGGVIECAVGADEEINAG
jgi:acetolactate synthase-1/2/3 large subunit